MVHRLAILLIPIITTAFGAILDEQEVTFYEHKTVLVETKTNPCLPDDPIVASAFYFTKSLGQKVRNLAVEPSLNRKLIDKINDFETIMNISLSRDCSHDDMQIQDIWNKFIQEFRNLLTEYTFSATGEQQLLCEKLDTYFGKLLDFDWHPLVVLRRRTTAALEHFIDLDLKRELPTLPMSPDMSMPLVVSPPSPEPTTEESIVVPAPASPVVELSTVPAVLPASPLPSIMRRLTFSDD